MDLKREKERSQIDVQILRALPKTQWVTPRNVVKLGGLAYATITAVTSLKRLVDAGYAEARREQVSGKPGTTYRKLRDMPKARSERSDVRSSRVVTLSSAYSTTEPMEAHVSLPREPWL